MTDAEQKIFDELDLAFDHMELAMDSLKKAGMDLLAREFGSRWVEVNDDFHAERAGGGDGSHALRQIMKLEDEIVRAMNNLSLSQSR